MLNRRRFNQGVAALAASQAFLPSRASAATYKGPNVVLVRFGGGVRRRETIETATSYAPYLVNELIPRGVFIPDMMIDTLKGGDTSHAEGTINILTGRYKAYRDAGSRFLMDRLEPTEPTLFEYLRDAYGIASHEALLINGEDRPQEEFLTYGTNTHYGIQHRSEMLSLHRYKLFKAAQIIADPNSTDIAIGAARKERESLLAKEARPGEPPQSAPIEAFWRDWRDYYGDSGLKNPRGDRLLTELALQAMTKLRPRLMMINYQDPDYVHWGNMSHYTRAITVIDEGLKRLVAAVEANPFYRDNTVFVVTPDCGRDANPLMDVPFQHHFNSRQAREVWALFFGTNVPRGEMIDKPFDQTAIAPTIAALMGFRARNAENTAINGVLG